MSSTVIVDAMGGDFSPAVSVEASIQFCNENKKSSIILVGNEKEIFQHLGKTVIPNNLEIHHAPEVIFMDEKPSIAYRQKPKSSIHVGLELLKEGKGDAFFSTGNTGAVITTAYFALGLLPNITRPALSIMFPAQNGHKVVFLDLGATVDPKPEHLRDFAHMGEAFSCFVTEKRNPKVSILSVGQEEGKGNALVIETAKLIKDSVNYAGFIEGNHLLSNEDIDVVVTDGFTGNVTLKTIEGLTETIYSLLKARITPYSGWLKLHKILIKKFFASTFSRFDYSLYGSSVVLGVNKLVGIGHGRSNVTAFKTGIQTLSIYAENNFIDHFSKRVAEKSEKSQ